MGHLNSPNISFYFHFLIVIKDSNIHKNKVFRFCRVHIKGYFFIKFLFFFIQWTFSREFHTGSSTENYKLSFKQDSYNGTAGYKLLYSKYIREA